MPNPIDKLKAAATEAVQHPRRTAEHVVGGAVGIAKGSVHKGLEVAGTLTARVAGGRDGGDEPQARAVPDLPGEPVMRVPAKKTPPPKKAAPAKKAAAKKAAKKTPAKKAPKKAPAKKAPATKAAPVAEAPPPPPPAPAEAPPETPTETPPETPEAPPERQD